jgi:outer membrane receptor protein involved in Fe transport
LPLALAGLALICGTAPARLAAQQPPGASDTGHATVEPVRTSVTIIEKLSTEAPASLNVYERPKLTSIPGVNVDDRLRMVPGFSPFRRNSSLTAHPTTQGISLRGIGSSGASRALALWDGVPLNDPFGGWIYWTRLAPDELDRVEVSRGASTSVFGDRAMGGAVSLFTRQPEQNRASASYEFGNRNTNSVTAGYSHLLSRYALSGNVRGFTTNGYYIAAEPDRGPMDREANVRFLAPQLRFDYFGSTDRLFLKSDLLIEERVNGTSLQRNSTSLGAVSASYARDWSRDGLTLMGYHTRGEFRSLFSVISADRRTERLSSTQSVPSEAEGGAGYWSHRGSNWRTLAGADLLRIEGYSVEQPYPAGARRTGGGTVWQQGTFLQVEGEAGPAKLFAGGRYSYAGRGTNFFSPSGGVILGRQWWRVRASAYRSFRAPTLNELYREFRQGNSVTLANDKLEPETLTGIESGFDVYGESVRLSVTGFYNWLDALVGNATLSSTPAQILRQRQNIGEAAARGFEADLRHRWRNFSTELSYLFSDSRFTTGLRTPQVPKHQGSGQVIWSRNSTMISGGFRSSAHQFDDDLNRFLLPGYATAFVSAQQRLVSRLSAAFVLENMLDRQYLTGFTPVAAIGPPRLWRAGLRWDGKLF